MSNTIKVSIIMPCYNDGQYLMEAIESVALENNKDTEVIIIDDGSDDGKTPQILSGIAHERIHVLHTEHVGPSAARNTGIAQAQGCYILPLDADDRIEACYISQAATVLDQGAHVGAVYCHADLFGQASGPWKLPDYSFERMLVENLVFVTAMFRKADWETVGGFRTDMKDGLEDYDFFMGILALGREIVQLPEVLFHYRIKKKSRTTSFVRDQEAVKRAFANVYEHHKAFYQEHAALYANLLRNELIQEKYEKERLMQMNGWMLKLKQIPLVNWLGKKILRR